MESNLNYQELRKYSEDFSSQVIDAFFEKNDRINGSEILSLTEIKQINLFVIFNLFRNWKDEMKKIESPYFDYSKKEVKKSMREMMNVLSRNISIDKEHFYPLLSNAVHDTLWILLSPYEYYCNLVNPESESRIKVKELEDFIKYVNINKPLLETYLGRLKELGDEIFIDDANRILNEVFADTDYLPADLDDYIDQFNAIKKLKVEKIFKSSEGEQKEGTQKEDSSIELSDSSDHVTLNDTLKNEKENPTLADVHARKKILSIKDTLTINQKFMFINQLFDGNVEDFNKIVDFVDQSNSFEQASDFLYNNYIKKNSWKKESQEVVEFLEIVEKKFTEDS